MVWDDDNIINSGEYDIDSTGEDAMELEILFLTAGRTSPTMIRIRSRRPDWKSALLSTTTMTIEGTPR
ncbi:unnamed protein product [Linum trigynum]|uniref:Uncharacterized protein n=1 Tax=Linum trigynum TaxID=586398 RepID=A0AAV2EYJ3_9ROSI